VEAMMEQHAQWRQLDLLDAIMPTKRWQGFAGGRTSSDAFYSDGYWTGPIKNRNVTSHSPEQNDPRLRHASAAVVDDKVI
jgi:hypothetical protein